MLRKVNNIYQFDELKVPELLHAFSTVSLGNMSYKFGAKDAVDQNRLAFSEEVEFDPKKVAQMDLQHGTDISVVSTGLINDLTSQSVLPKVDALVTNKQGVALWLITGDCAPIIFYDPKNKAVGLAHSGWRGTIGKIAVLTAVSMMLNFKTDPHDLQVAFGPTIEKCCYVKQTDGWQQTLPEWHGFWGNSDKDGIWIDLNGFSINELKKIGVKSENIFYSQVCTKDQRSDFFSQQAERAGLQEAGRFATVVSLL